MEKLNSFSPNECHFYEKWFATGFSYTRKKKLHSNLSKTVGGVNEQADTLELVGNALQYDNLQLEGKEEVTCLKTPYLVMKRINIWAVSLSSQLALAVFSLEFRLTILSYRGGRK